jgi:hypothetical protein
MDAEMLIQIESLVHTIGVVAIGIGLLFGFILLMQIIQTFYEIAESQAKTRYYNKMYLNECEKSKKKSIG